MIDVPDAARSVIDSGTFTYYVRAQAWLGDQLLAEDVPLAGGTEDSDLTLNVPERLTLEVPRLADDTDWTPTFDEHPLAANGQTLKLSLGVGMGRDGIAWFQRGEYLIQSAEESDDVVKVVAVGLLALVDEAKFVTPFQPTGTIGSTLRALMEPAVTVDLDDAPADRAVPVSSINWDADRLGAVGELLDAWPAVLRMHPQGYAEILADVAPTVSVRSFTNDPATGTIVTAAGATSRDGGFNVVVATGYAADGAEVRGVAQVESGPWAFGVGTANPLPVPFGYSSPLISTNAQAAAAARTVLRRKMRQSVLRAFTITCPPDPTIQLGDPVDVTTDHVDELLCTVERIGLPLFPGTMTLRVVSTA
jgi:hypothetical protein